MSIGYFAIAAFYFVVDMASLIRDTGRQVDWDLITNLYLRGGFIVKLNGNAAADAVTLTIDPLQFPLKKGYILDFGAKKFAQLTQDEAATVTTLHVEALATAIADNTEAVGVTVIDGEEHRFLKEISASTVMVEVDPATNRKIIPLAIHPDGTSATGQVMVALTDMKNYSKTDALTGYGVTFGGMLYENHMADSVAGLLPTGWKTFLGARYVWKKARDSRAA